MCLLPYHEPTRNTKCEKVPALSHDCEVVWLYQGTLQNRDEEVGGRADNSYIFPHACVHIRATIYWKRTNSASLLPVLHGTSHPERFICIASPTKLTPCWALAVPNVSSPLQWKHLCSKVSSCVGGEHVLLGQHGDGNAALTSARDMHVRLSCTRCLWSSCNYVVELHCRIEVFNTLFLWGFHRNQFD